MPAGKEQPPAAKDWFFNTFSPFDGDVQMRFLYYGTGGLMDPKNYTLEPWALSGGGSAAFWKWKKARWASFGKGFLRSQALAFFGMGLIGVVFDPLGYDDTGGMDEVWGDIYDWGVPEDHWLPEIEKGFLDAVTGKGRVHYYNPIPGI